MCSNSSYIQYGCGMQTARVCSLNHDITLSLGPHLTAMLQNWNWAPHLDIMCNSLRVHPYAHPPHMKVLNTWHTYLILSWDAVNRKYILSQYLHRHNSLRFHPCAHPQHMKVLKHFIYVYIGCWMQSAGACSLNHDTTTSIGSTLPQLNKNKFPGLHCTSMGIIV